MTRKKATQSDTKSRDSGGTQISCQGRLGLGKGGLGQRGIPPQQHQVVQVVAKFVVAKIDQNSNKIAKKRKKAPKSVTKPSGITLPELVGSSRAALGALLPPGHPERSQERQNSSPRPIFRVFFCVIFGTSHFASIFLRFFKDFLSLRSLRNHAPA